MMIFSGSEDASRDFDNLVAQVTSKARLLDNVKPRPPPKVILYFSRESKGMSWQGHDLAARIGVPHVDMIGLVKDAGNNARKGVTLLKSRLAQVDCKKHGTS